jgi:hypothetical protein
VSKSYLVGYALFVAVVGIWYLATFGLFYIGVGWTGFWGLLDAAIFWGLAVGAAKLHSSLFPKP